MVFLSIRIYGWTLKTFKEIVFLRTRKNLYAVNMKVFRPNYLAPERKIGFFVKIKEDENFNHRNTGRISRIKI
jgi:hypothetical protein